MDYRLRERARGRRFVRSPGDASSAPLCNVFPTQDSMLIILVVRAQARSRGSHSQLTNSVTKLVKPVYETDTYRTWIVRYRIKTERTRAAPARRVHCSSEHSRSNHKWPGTLQRDSAGARSGAQRSVSLGGGRELDGGTVCLNEPRSAPHAGFACAQHACA